jgi:hypothetical protein
LSEETHQAITTAINAELQRQAMAGAHRVDIDALAGAVERVIDDEEHIHLPQSEGRRPYELNSDNDG